MSPEKSVSTSPRNIWTPPAGLEGAALVAAINDRFRQCIGSPGRAIVPGRAVVTCGIAALDPLLQFATIRCVREFADFSEGDDPNGERDFGAFRIEGVAETIFWKIDVYADENMEWGAEDAADLDASYRVLTILLASEY